MKAILNILLLGGALLLASTSDSGALPPRQHRVSGVITTINYETRTITLAPGKGNEPLVFVWKDYTRFSQGWNRICVGALQSGHPITVHYRHEVGQLVPREVSLRTDVPTPCTNGRCCAKRD